MLSILLTAVALLLLTPTQSLACACGCSVFDVSTRGMLPSQTGGLFFVEYDYMNQDQNWRGLSSGPAADNGDKEIRNHFFTVGAQYMFNRSWGAEVNFPIWQRHFVTTDEMTGTSINSDHLAFGDMRIKGIYSGFSEDMSTGITFGLKLPTGDHSYPNFDRDTQIGTGSTDLLLGAHHEGHVTGLLNWFAIGEWDQPILAQGGYRPGTEITAVSGVYYDGWYVGSVKIAPVAQAIGTVRFHDSGPAAMPADSGYERLVLAPGIEIEMAPVRMYADVGFPVLQYVRGNQLVASALFKFNVSYSF